MATITFTFDEIIASNKAFEKIVKRSEFLKNILREHMGQDYQILMGSFADSSIAPKVARAIEVASDDAIAFDYINRIVTITQDPEELIQLSEVFSKNAEKIAMLVDMGFQAVMALKMFFKSAKILAGDLLVDLKELSKKLNKN